MWTHGYELYAPGRNFIFHEYFHKGKPRPKYWEVDWARKYDEQTKSSRRVMALLGVSCSAAVAFNF